MHKLCSEYAIISFKSLPGVTFEDTIAAVVCTLLMSAVGVCTPLVVVVVTVGTLMLAVGVCTPPVVVVVMTVGTPLMLVVGVCTPLVVALVVVLVAVVPNSLLYHLSSFVL